MQNNTEKNVRDFITNMNNINISNISTSESKMNEINTIISSVSNYIEEKNPGYIKKEFLLNKIPNGVEYLQKLHKFALFYDDNAGKGIIIGIISTFYSNLDKYNTNSPVTILYDTFKPIYERYRTAKIIMNIINNQDLIDRMGLNKTKFISNIPKYTQFYDALCAIIIYINNKIDGTEQYSVHDRFVSLLLKCNILKDYNNGDIKGYIKTVLDRVASDSEMKTKRAKYREDPSYNEYADYLEIFFIIDTYPSEIHWDRLIDNYRYLQGQRNISVESTNPVFEQSISKPNNVQINKIKTRLEKNRDWLNRNLPGMQILKDAFMIVYKEYLSGEKKKMLGDLDLVQFCNSSQKGKISKCELILNVSTQIGMFIAVEKEQEEIIKQFRKLGGDELYIVDICKSHPREINCNMQGGYTKKRKNNKQRSRKLRR